MRSGGRRPPRAAPDTGTTAGAPPPVELLRATIAAGSEVFLTASGTCMEPWIRDGDRIRLGAFPTGDPRIGAVALAAPPDGRLLCHRVLEVDGGDLVLGGDRSPPERIPRSAVLGRVEEVERSGRRLGLLADRVTERILRVCRALPRRPGEALRRRLLRLAGHASWRYRAELASAERASETRTAPESGESRPAANR